MASEIKTYCDLADFIEVWLRGQLESRWDLDDLESVPLAKREGQPLWSVEIWRQCILDLMQAKTPPEGQYMHPDASAHLESLMMILRFIDQHDDS